MKMIKSTIIDILSKILLTSKKTFEDLDDNYPLVGVGMDSLKYLEFIVNLEDKFNVEFLDNDMKQNNFETIEKTVRIVSKYLEKKSMCYKCLVLDCDGVLWHGVAGEAGKDEPFLDECNLKLQHFLIELTNKGIYICLCSKNTVENISNIISKYCVFNLDNMDIIKTSVSNKARAILEIANQLNIFVDSIVFIDDSEYELTTSSMQLPGLKTIVADMSNSFFQELESLFVSSFNSQHFLDRHKLIDDQ